MKTIQTTKHTRSAFSVLHRTRSAQASTTTKHDPHEGKSSARSLLLTVHLYIPAAYASHGEPLRG